MTIHLRPPTSLLPSLVRALVGSALLVCGARAEAASVPRPGLVFEPNVGQAQPAVRFLARGPGYQAQITATSLTYAIPAAPAAAPRPGQPVAPVRPSPMHVVKMELLGGNSQATVSGAEPRTGHSNYLIGRAEAQWHREVPHFGRVKVAGVYPGVDLVAYGSPQALEHDFVVSPGADPGAIRLRFSGVTKLAVDARGDLVLGTSAGRLTQERPIAYQDLGGRRQSVASRFVVAKNGDVRFALGAYDRSRPLVIDPILKLSKRVGGSSTEYGMDVATDSGGNIYVTGITESVDLQPTAGAPDTTVALMDAFVTKLSPSGAIVYATYLGGGGYDRGFGIDVDSSGKAYVTGDTDSTDLPATTGFQTSKSTQQNSFIAVLNTTGTAFSYFSYVGGTAGQFGVVCRDILVVSASDVWLTGHTGMSAMAFPVNGFQKIFGGFLDSFLLRVNPSTTGAASHRYFTYWGAGNQEYGVALTKRPAGGILMGGYGNSGTLMGAKYGPRGGFDMFVLASTGASFFEGAIHIGGSGTDWLNDIGTDTRGNQFIVGSGLSSDYPVQASTPLNPISQPVRGGGEYDVYVSKLNPSGAPLWSTYLGGTAKESYPTLAITPGGFSYVLGTVDAAGSFPVTADARQSLFAGGSTDMFLTKYSPEGKRLYSSYHGGSGADEGGNLVFRSGTLVIAGTAGSGTFPGTNEVGPGWLDAVTSKFASSALFVVGSTTLTASDNAIKGRLTALGFEVTAKAAAQSTTADANQRDLIVISNTVSSTDVGVKFRDVTTPVLNMEDSIQDDMQLTGAVLNTDFGVVSNQTSLAMVTSSDPLSAGLSGTVAVVTAPRKFDWGRPGSGAVKVAALTTDANRIGIYRYEEGASMVGLSAPGRRVGFFLWTDTAEVLNSSGTALLDAAIKWAAGF